MTDITWTNVTVKLSQLIPWEDNPKTSTAKNAKQLQTSKDELGQFQTVAIEPTDKPDKFRVADGHQRLSAWLLAYGKDSEIDARLASRELSETERRKVAIYSRQIGAFNFDTISGWDEPLIDWGLDNDTLADWGKQYGELAAMLGAEEEPPTEGDAEPQTNRAEELRELWGVELGQMWAIGEHRLICGDCTDRAVVDRLMGGEKADIGVHDPPYNLGGHMETGMYSGSSLTSHKELSDTDWDNEYDIVPFLTLMDKYISANSSLYIFSSHFLAGDIWRETAKYMDRIGWCIWDKGNPTPSMQKRHWTWSAELVCYATRGRHTFNFPDSGHIKNVWTFNKEVHTSPHPTEKPVVVIQHPIKASSSRGDIVADFFAGSGTTLVACQNLARKCRAIEISPAYCAVILQRMTDAFPDIDIHRIEGAA